MEKSNQVLKISTICKDWLTITETFEALKAGGLPTFSLAKLRKQIKEKALPIQTAQFFGRVYCKRAEVLAFIAQAGGLDPQEAQPAEGVWLSFREAVELFQAAGLPFTLTALRKAYNQKRLPFEAFRFGGRVYCKRAEVLALIAQAQNPKT